MLRRPSASGRKGAESLQAWREAQARQTGRKENPAAAVKETPTRGPRIFSSSGAETEQVSQDDITDLLDDLAAQVGVGPGPDKKKEEGKEETAPATKKNEEGKAGSAKERIEELRSRLSKWKAKEKKKEKGGRSSKDVSPAGRDRTGISHQLLKRAIAAEDAALGGKKKQSKKSEEVQESSTSSASSETSSSTEEKARASSSSHGNAVLMQVRKEPGKLLMSGLQMMQSFVAGAEGPTGMGSEKVRLGSVRRLVTTYLTTALLPSKGGALGLRHERELRTIAEALDCMVSGKLGQAADILMQRFRAIETASVDGGWDLAKHMELIPETNVSCVPMEMRSQAFRTQALQQKISASQRLRGIATWPAAQVRARVTGEFDRGRDQGARHVSFDLDQGDRRSVLRSPLGGYRRNEEGNGQGRFDKGAQGKGKNRDGTFFQKYRSRS